MNWIQELNKSSKLIDQFCWNKIKHLEQLRLSIVKAKCDIIEDECPKCGSNSIGVAFGVNECFDCGHEWGS